MVTALALLSLTSLKAALCFQTINLLLLYTTTL